MYINIGNDMAVRESALIGIFDMDNTTVSKNTRDFLAEAQTSGKVFNVSSELPKTFVVCRDAQGNETVYISQISAATLRGRVKNGLINTGER